MSNKFIKIGKTYCNRRYLETCTYLKIVVDGEYSGIVAGSPQDPEIEYTWLYIDERSLPHPLTPYAKIERQKRLEQKLDEIVEQINAGE